MNKLGIWAIAIAGAFVIGILSANPVVEAVGGWQGAFDGLDARITELESSTHTELSRTTFSVSGAELTMMSSQNSFCALTNEYATASGTSACEIVERTGNWVLKANIPSTCTASCLQWTP